MANKRPTLTCKNCRNLDRDTYKGNNTLVCYHIKHINNIPVAIGVTENTKSCGYFRQINLMRQ